MAQNRPDRTLGPCHDEFWDWCNNGELRLQRCLACQNLSWPATQSCEHCGGASLRWDRMCGRGKIVGCCTFEKDYFRGLLPIPWETIVVELDEGPLFLSNPQSLADEKMQVGSSVRVAFVECEDAHGIFQLPVFEPDNDAF